MPCVYPMPCFPSSLPFEGIPNRPECPTDQTTRVCPRAGAGSRVRAGKRVPLGRCAPVTHHRPAGSDLWGRCLIDEAGVRGHIWRQIRTSLDVCLQFADGGTAKYEHSDCRAHESLWTLLGLEQCLCVMVGSEIVVRGMKDGGWGGERGLLSDPGGGGQIPPRDLG